MKKTVSKMTAAAMLCGCLAGVSAVPAAAEESGIQAMQALAEEMNAIEQASVEGTISMAAEDQEVTLLVTAQRQKNLLSDVNVTLKVMIPDMEDMEVTAEDVLRVTEDGCYINIEAILGAATELMGEDMSEMAAYFGITGEWIGFMASDLPVFPAEDFETLAADIEEKLIGCMDSIAVSEVGNGYQAVYTAEDCKSVLEAVQTAADENLENWLTMGIAILEKTDISPLIDAYAGSIQEGISESDETFDGEGFLEQMEELKTLLPQLAASLDAAELAASIREEDILAELEETESISLNGTYTLTKDAEGVYEISVVQNVEEYGSTSVLNTSWKITPAEGTAAEAPASYTDSREIVKAAAPFVYEFLGMSSDDGPNEGDTDSYELIVEGNRFQVSDIWDELLYWVEYDSDKLELDVEFSSPYNVFLDFADSYSYISLSIEDSENFAEYCATKTEWYSENENYNMTDPVVLEGDLQISYVVMSYTIDEWEYAAVLFGTDLDEHVTLYGEFDLEDEMTEEDIVSYINAAIVSLEKVDAD